MAKKLIMKILRQLSNRMRHMLLVFLWINVVRLSEFRDELNEEHSSMYINEKNQSLRKYYPQLLYRRLWETTHNGRTNMTQIPKEQLQRFKTNNHDSYNNGFQDDFNIVMAPERPKRSVLPIGKSKENLVEDPYYGFFGHCFNISLFSDEPFMMIDICPHSARNIQDVKFCHHPVSTEKFQDCIVDVELIPVSDSRGYIYKNLYCARCHNVFNVTTWEVELIYDTYSPFRFMDSKQSMTLFGNFKEKSKCMPFVYPLKPEGKVLCKNFKQFDEISLFHKNRYRHTHRKVEETGSEYPLSFTILINFGMTGKGHAIFTTETMAPIVEHHCEEDKVYDPEIKGCRSVVCKDGFKMVDKKCVHNTQKYETITDKRINDAANSEFLTQIIYRYNVSRLEALLFSEPAACEIITYAFADMINISIARIVNFKIDLRNGTFDTKVELHQIVWNEQEERSQNGTYSDSDCNSHIRNLVLLEDFYAEYRFSILPSVSRNESSRASKNEIKTKLLQLNGNFVFSINGTEFETANPGATTPVVMDLWCVKGRKHRKNETEFDLVARTDKNGVNVTGVFVNNTGKFYPPGMYDLWMWVMGNIGSISELNGVAYSFICDLPEIEDENCVRFVIHSSNYTRLDNSSVKLGDKRVLNMNEYEYVDLDDNSTDIQICVPPSYLTDPIYDPIKFGCGEEYDDVVKAEGYLSFVLGITSIVVLFTVIITYGIFGKLRNLPGLNLMSLTLSLCVGELLFITSGYVHKNGVRCQIIGVFIHFIFLASFFWMNVMSYDVYCTFAKTKCILNRIRRIKKYFPLYSLYAWGCPALIVGCCCVIDFAKIIPNFTINYGGSSGDTYEYESADELSTFETDKPKITKLYRQKFGCWIQEPVAALVAFGLPMIIILFANTIMFIRTIICIRAVKKSVSVRTRHSSLNNSIGQHDVILYVRMSTVMGFTWIFGLASSIVSSFSDKPTSTVCVVLHVLGMLFIILNCSQGLFIFFVFVFNRRVGTLYKDLFGRLRCTNKQSRCSSSSSIRTTENSLPQINEITHF